MRHLSFRPSNLAEILTSWLIAFSIFCGVSGTVHLWSTDGPVLFSSARLPVGLSGLAVLLLIYWNKKRPKLQPQSFGVALLLLFFSDWFSRSYNLLQGPPIRGELVLGALVTLLLLRNKIDLGKIAGPLLIAVLVFVLTGSFLLESGGRILFSDDHPVFQFRLELLKQNFPFIPFYSPLWNGGIDARDFFATGSLNFFFLLSPLIYLFDIQSSYNFLIALLLFGVLPSGMYFACRVERLRSPTPIIAALLAVTASLFWYRWALKYGTVGFITSASFLPLNLVILARVLSPARQLTRGLALISVITVTFSLFWSLSGFVFLPGIVLSLLFIRRVFFKKYARLIAVLLLAVNIPWMVMFWKVSNVSNFVKAENIVEARHIATPGAEATVDKKLFRHRTGSFNVTKSVAALRQNVLSANPLLSLLLLPGLFVLRRTTRLVYGVTLLWLSVVGGALIPVKPQLELDRMLVLFFLLSALPVAECIRRVFLYAHSRPSFLNVLSTICIGAVLFAAPFSVAGVLGNRSVEQFYFANDEVEELGDAIDEFGGDGRVLFSGFVLHELSQGHLAPLVFRTTKQLMASSHVHDKWQYRQIVPAEFMVRGSEGIEEYFDLYNVSAVVAHERPWIRHFERHSERYSLKWTGKTFRIFSRAQKNPGYFFEGEGEVHGSSSNAVEFSLDSPDAVLKFNHFPFVEVKGCTVSPEIFPGEVKLIRLQGCPVHQPLTLHSVGPIRRLLGGGS